MNQKQAQTQQQLEASGDLFPNTPLHVEKLRAMNMDVTLDATDTPMRMTVAAPTNMPARVR